MQYKAIFFDLDGTLLPLEQQTFTKAYFGQLSQVLANYNITPQQTVQTVQIGMEQMKANTTPATNQAVFWQAFSAALGQDTAALQQDCDAFYSHQFHELRACTSPNPLAKAVVAAAKQQAGRVVLATNPVFPLAAQVARLSWLGLTPEDFDLVTHYSNSTRCKPQPAYYTEICQKLQLAPADCLMVGNDELEDMYAATQAGLRCLLLTDHLLPSAEHPWRGERCSFAQFSERLLGEKI